MTKKIVDIAVRSTSESDISMCKFITPNDVGATGGHQSGFHIHKSTYKLFFDVEGQKGANKDKFIKIKWQDDFETYSRAIYYGIGTRNEYRLTRFGKGFPFLSDKNIGDLLVITRKNIDCYEAFVLNTDSEIGEFLDTFGMSPVDTNAIINTSGYVRTHGTLEDLFVEEAKTFKDFPSTKIVAETARLLFNKYNKISEEYIRKNPDKIILNWMKAEYSFYLLLENHLCSDILGAHFKDTESFVKAANSIANRRKSRAGRSLELHLEEIFNSKHVKFDSQVYTEGKKCPDFIFPGDEEYHDFTFPDSSLVLLAAKTTCKDRWRQVINEADRIKTKHLFTLQQGISSSQLSEMYGHEINLVVPSSYIDTFPKEYRDRIFSLDGFIELVKRLQS